EKTALGFFLSGHLFDEYEAEVRQFVRTPVAALEDSRETQRVAGIVSGLRSANGPRGKVTIFTLDDKSGAIEAVADEALMARCGQHIREDELLVLSARYQPGRNGFEPRLSVQDALDLPSARCAFGRWLKLDWQAPQQASNAQQPLQQLQAWLQAHQPAAHASATEIQPPQAEGDEAEPARPRGVRLRIRLRCQGAQGQNAAAELLLPEAQAIFPSEQALHALRVHNGGAGVQMVYP
ncbi:MAG: DNA polymerase III subunit alpha, partial [Comamonadaceae bacterium]|nr:DNA polymerase III subunit alpha [Comamonadaceae bacterium]